MNPNIKTEIRKKLSNTRFYQPLSQLSHIELNLNGFTTYNFNGDESFVRLFAPTANDSVNSQPSTSAAAASSNNFVQPQQPPPRKKKFEQTVVQINGDNKVERVCQLCNRSYRTKRHQNQFRGNNICCVCREQFPDEESLIEHAEQTLRANICCVIDCQMPLTDDERKKIHLNRHR